MTRPFSTVLKRSVAQRSKPSAIFSTNELRPVARASSLRRCRGRFKVRPVPKTRDKRGGPQRYILTYARKSMTLKQWAARGEAGLKPSNIWSRLRLGLEVQEALGGRVAVRRALSFISEREQRAARQQAKLLAQQQRKVVRRRPRGRPPVH